MFKSRLGRSTLAIAGLLLGVYGAENWLGERFGATALLLYLPQHGWGLPPLLLLLAALWLRRWNLVLFNAAVLLGWSHFLLGGRFLPRISAISSGKSFRLMTYNIERGAKGEWAIEAAIRAQKPDIVCLQESQGSLNGRGFAPGARIAARFPGWRVAKSGDVLTLSRFRLISSRSYPLRGTRRILETTLQTPRGPVRILNIHVSTSFQNSAAPTRGKFQRIGRIMKHAQPSAQARLDQIAPLQAAIARDKTTPLLVAGDFNSPPRGLFYRAISRGMEDAWARGGFGIGSTFPARFPVLPIDHVLARGLTVRRAFVPPARASDHLPLVADF